MAILSIQTESIGQSGVNPRLVRIVSDNTIAEVQAPDYLEPASLQGYTILPTDFIFMSCSDGDVIFTVDISGGVITLVLYPTSGPFDSLQNVYNASASGNITTVAGKPFTISGPASGRAFSVLTTVQRNAIASPATGLTVYNSDTNLINFWNGSTWVIVGGSASAINITDDNSTNATMLPVWVTGNSGAQPTFVSSNIFQFNPGAGPTITTAPTFSISSTGLVYSNVTSDTIGSVNEAGNKLYRGDQANGYAQMHYGTAGSDEWVIGLRAGDVNYHIFNQGLDEDVLFIDSSGNVNLPLLTPSTLLGLDVSKNVISVATDAFSAYASSAQNNVTGAGTLYTVQFDTQAGGPSPNYNTGTGIYTAPADGFYQFSAGVNIFGLDSGMTALKLSLLLNGTQEYIIAGNSPFAGQDASGNYTATGAVTVPMSAGDTANITLEIDGGAGDNASIFSSSNPIFTFFTGSLVKAT